MPIAVLISGTWFESKLRTLLNVSGGAVDPVTRAVLLVSCRSMLRSPVSAGQWLRTKKLLNWADTSRQANSTLPCGPLAPLSRSQDVLLGGETLSGSDMDTNITIAITCRAPR